MIKNIWSEYSDNFTLLILAVGAIAVLLRLVCMAVSDLGYGEADATARVLISFKWMDEPFIFAPIRTIWPPFQFYIYGLALMVVSDPLYVPILINILFGSLLVVITGCLVRRLTDDSLTALIAALVVCFYPLAIRFSLIATPEVILNFFLFLTLYILLGISKSDPGENKFGQAVLATMTMSAAVLTHLQAWFLMPIFSFLLLKKWKYWLCFVGITMLPMIAYLLHLQNIYDAAVPPKLIYGAAVPPAWDHSNDSTYQIRQALYYPALLIDTLSPALILLCVTGIIKTWEKEGLCWNIKYFPIICFFALIPPYLYFVYSWDRMRPKEALLLCIFLIPYAAIGLRFLASTINANAGKWIVIVTSISILLIVPYNWKYISKGNIFPIPRTSPEYRRLAQWINTNIDSTDAIVFDHLPLWSDYYLAINSKRMPDQVFLGLDTFSPERLVHLKRFIKKKQPKLLVLSKDPTTVSAALELRCRSDVCPDEAFETRLQVHLKKVFETEQVVVYRMRKLGP